MSLSKVFTIAAIIVWSTSAQAVYVAGIEVNEKRYPKTMRFLSILYLDTAYYKGTAKVALELSINNMKKLSESFRLSLERIRDDLFPEGDPVTNRERFLDDEIRCCSNFDNINVRVWKKLTEINNYLFFSETLQELKRVQTWLDNLMGDLIGISTRAEDYQKTKNTSDEERKNFRDKELKQLCTSFLEILNETGDAPKELTEIKKRDCPRTPALDDWLDDKNMDYPSFNMKNNLFFSMLHRFFKKQVYENCEKCLIDSETEPVELE